MQKKLHKALELQKKFCVFEERAKNMDGNFGFLMEKHRKNSMFFWKNNKKNATTSIQCAGERMAYYLLYIKIKLLLNKFCFEKEIK